MYARIPFYFQQPILKAEVSQEEKKNLFGKTSSLVMTQCKGNILSVSARFYCTEKVKVRLKPIVITMFTRANRLWYKYVSQRSFPAASLSIHVCVCLMFFVKTLCMVQKSVVEK